MSGLHHVTAICGMPTRNLDFYTRILGLRFVKKTVNFDDPGTYHFYYGEKARSARQNHPDASLLREHALSWPSRALGRRSRPRSASGPLPAIGYWTHRFIEKGVAHGRV